MAKKNTDYYNPEIIAKFRAEFASALEDVKAGRDLRVRISNGNSKMGDVASVSLLPFLSCPGCCGNSCGRFCYAAKIANMRPSVLRAYAVNQAIAVLRPDLYWVQVRAAVAGCRWFRFGVSGDILNRAYLAEMVRTAIESPWCRFLCFTKNFAVVNAWIDENGPLSENLHILFSKWGDLPVPNPHNLPCSAVVFHGCDPDPDWLVCGGNCYNCACRGVGCWALKPGETVCFRQH